MSFVMDSGTRRYLHGGRIYIAGPMTPRGTGDAPEGLIIEYLRNVRAMLLAKRQLIHKGWFPFCPGEDLLTFLAGGDDVVISDKEIRDTSIGHLLGCDAIVMIGSWSSSTGACAEWRIAVEHGLDVYYHVEDVPDVHKE